MRAVEKAVGGKAQKTSFTTNLGNPATARDSHFAHSPDGDDISNKANTDSL
jgi:hypothetical protein